VTAGNASGVNDGAAALIIASSQQAIVQGLTPRARIVAMATAGVEPKLMGLDRYRRYVKCWSAPG
jgi:3-oxo-5,6-didehydrosuberyl-CoA/3-oxoadipyl-CoA thiolase